MQNSLARDKLSLARALSLTGEPLDLNLCYVPRLGARNHALILSPAVPSLGLQLQLGRGSGD